MRYLWIVLCLSLTMGGWAQEDGVIDAAMVDETVRLAAPPSKRLAPSAPARVVDLPPTVTPPSNWEGYNQPFFVAGYIASAPPDLSRAIRWTRYEDKDGNRGQVGVLILRSQNAKSLRVRFSGRRWQPQLQLRVFDPAGGYAFPHTFPMWDENGDWWTTIIFGEQIGLEFFIPDTADKAVVPDITAIAYHFAGPDLAVSDFEPASGCPLNDVSCFPAWRNFAALSVCMLSVIGGGGNVAGFCSGNAINRTPQDFAPIVMTARHCVGDQAEANATVFVWNYFTATCNGTPPNPNSLPRSTGSLLLKQHQNSDWTLLGSYEPMAAGAYVGWDTSFIANGTELTAISHPMVPAPPSGPFMRVAFAQKTGETRCVTTGVDADTWQVRWTNSTIRRGSSGSALLDASIRARGTASCVSTCILSDPKCCPPNPNALGYYGRIDVAFPGIQWYLQNMANPTFVNRAVSGDAGNGGANERGTSGNPFNTVYEGTFCVPTSGTVRIVPGNYNERFRVWRAMRLERSGTSGVVRIGAP